jgi:hypothetical protein
MKLIVLGLTLLSFLVGNAVLAGSNDNLNTILDLEAKISHKVQSIIQPVDPDAIVIAKVEVIKINTELAGTQMTAVGILSTADVQSVEEGDIQSITVSIISSLDPFPEDIKKLIETTLRSFSKKARVKITKMTDSVAKAIIDGNKSKSELLEKSKTGWQKTSELADQLSKMAKELPTVADGFKKSFLFILLQLIFVYSLIQGTILFFQKRTQGKSIGMLREALSALNINSSSKASDEERDPTATVARIPAAENQGAGSNSSASVTTKDNPIEQMYIPLIRDLISDCYWCHKDNYAAWVWSQLSPPKRMELLESWEALIYYVKFFTRLEPKADNYHLDPVYLKPHEYFMKSNEDLLAIVRANAYLWNEISMLRQKSFTIPLRERIDFMKVAGKFKPEKPYEWEFSPSKFRVLHDQLEVGELSIEDEAMIIQDPNMVPDVYRDNLHSLIWTAMLPQEDRDKILQKLPAQILAEVWVGPADVLQRLSEVLPPKKLELLESYLTKITPQRTHPVMKHISDLSLKRFRELYPPAPDTTEVVIPTFELGPITGAPQGMDEAQGDIDAIVAAFRDGKLDDPTTEFSTTVKPQVTTTMESTAAPEVGVTDQGSADSEESNFTKKHSA